MKTILITILIVILLLFGYNKYVDYKRHHPQTTDYIASGAIDTDPYNKKLLYNYYEAIETLNPNYAIENLLCSEITAKPIAALYFLI